MIIGIDFDGTCVTHSFPEIGSDIGAVPVLKELIANGHKLILWTMRSNTHEHNYLDDAHQWFKDNDIPLFGVNENPQQKHWTSSPKAYCQLYIDDAALGCPLTSQFQKSARDFVEWQSVRVMLVNMGLIGNTI